MKILETITDKQATKIGEILLKTCMFIILKK